MMRKVGRILSSARAVPFLLVGLALVFSACSSVECPLNNTVYSVYSLKGKVDTLKDTLTISAIRANGTDTVLWNRSTNTTSFQLPMSYGQEVDVLVFQLIDTTQTLRTDTVRVGKTNEPHFESVECGPVFFHTITGVSSTKNAIDSIVISNSKVTYDNTKTHFNIYFKPRD